MRVQIPTVTGYFFEGGDGSCNVMYRENATRSLPKLFWDFLLMLYSAGVTCTLSLCYLLVRK